MAVKIGNQNARKYKDKDELAKLIDKYFKDCDKDKRPYTMSGLAYALDIDRRTLLNYGENELFFPLVKRAKERVQAQLEENALMGKGNAVFTIFNLKNNYGWRDQQEVKMTNEIENLDTLADMLGFGKND